MADSTASVIADAAAVSQLQSLEHAELLDAIDKLREENISANIDIPQLVVCGDQSSGKSSVLEAIAQIRFPIGIGTTTRFATEVILRNAPESAIRVKLCPHSGRNQSDREYLKRFKPSSDLDQDRFPEVVKAAADHLAKLDGQTTFWEDLLQVEVLGPTQPHLTLVDLPGIIHFAGNGASAQDIPRIKQIVEKYIDSPRTTIIAVVSALNDDSNQQIMELVDSASRKKRTLGVITKPDRLEPGSDAEGKAIELAHNIRLPLDLGWHVLRNVRHEDTDRSAEHRQELETQFFSEGAWKEVDRNHVGIDSLRQRLSQCLLDCIKRELPKLRNEMQVRFDSCIAAQKQLGPPRDTLSEQTAYLSSIFGKVDRLARAGINGDYQDDEFLDFFDGDQKKHLRDLINGASERFATKIYHDGKRFYIYTRENEKDRRFPLLKPEQASSLDFSNSSRSDMYAVSLETYLTALAEHIQTTRGTNLPGTSSNTAIRAVFRQQSIRWKTIIRDYVDECYAAVFEYMRKAIVHIAGIHTGNALIREYVKPATEATSSQLKAKVEELLWPYMERHPMTYNPRYLARTMAKDGSLYEHQISQYRHPDRLLLAAQTLDRATTYYNIAIDTVIDNVATLAVEHCLVASLPHLISAEKFVLLDNKKISELAAQPPIFVEHHKKLQAQVTALTEVIETCRQHADMAVPTDSSVFDTIPEIELTDAPSTPSTRNTPSDRSSSTQRSSASTTATPVTPSAPLSNGSTWGPRLDMDDTPKPMSGGGFPFGAPNQWPVGGILGWSPDPSPAAMSGDSATRSRSPGGDSTRVSRSSPGLSPGGSVRRHLPKRDRDAPPPRVPGPVDSTDEEL